MRANEFINEETIPQSKFKHLLTPGVLALKDAMQNAGKEVRIVGGAVRDLVLGKDPKDIDMATDATPEEMMEIFDAAGISHIPTGLEHGTITAVLDGEPIEITTLRVDTETDGRHAEVEFTTDWKTDAERRDLTYNAMSLDLDGNLYDYFGGVEDLRKGVSKFVGDADKRMEEDYLRILRYFRFQARLDNPQFDNDTLRKIANNAKGLKNISGERIWMEMSKLLVAKNALVALRKMSITGVLEALGGPYSFSVVGFQDVKSITNDLVALLVVFCDEVEELEKVRKHWKISNEIYNSAKNVFKLASTFPSLNANKFMRVQLSRGVDRKDLMRVAWVLGDRELASNLRNAKVPQFPVRGQDLVDAGMKPGKDVGIALKKMRDAWEESGFKLSKDELIQTISRQ